MVNIPATVLLWGALVTAMVLAVRSAVKQPNDPPDPTGTDYSQPKAVATARSGRNETDAESLVHPSRTSALPTAT